MKLIDKVEAKLVRRIQEDIADLVFNAQLDEKSIIGIIRPDIAEFDNELVGVTYNYIKYLIYLKGKGENEIGAFEKFIKKLSDLDKPTPTPIKVDPKKVLSKEMLMARNKEREKIEELYEVLHEDNPINYNQFYGLKKAQPSEQILDPTLITQMEVEDLNTELKLEQNYQAYLDSTTDPTVDLTKLDDDTALREDKEEGGLNEEMEDLKANVAILSDQVIYLQSTISTLKEQLALKNATDLSEHVEIAVSDDTLQAPLNDPDQILTKFDLAKDKKKKNDDDEDETDPTDGEIPGQVEVVIIIDDEANKDSDDSQKDDESIDRDIDGEISDDPDSIPSEDVNDEVMPDLPKAPEYQDNEPTDPLEVNIVNDSVDENSDDVTIDEANRPGMDDSDSDDSLPNLDGLDDDSSMDDKIYDDDHEPDADDLDDIEPLVLDILDEINEIDQENQDINDELEIDETINDAFDNEIDETNSNGGAGDSNNNSGDQPTGSSDDWTGQSSGDTPSDSNSTGSNDGFGDSSGSGDGSTDSSNDWNSTETPSGDSSSTDMPGSSDGSMPGDSSGSGDSSSSDSTGSGDSTGSSDGSNGVEDNNYYHIDEEQDTGIGSKTDSNADTIEHDGTGTEDEPFSSPTDGDSSSSDTPSGDSSNDMPGASEWPEGSDTSIEPTGNEAPTSEPFGDSSNDSSQSDMPSDSDTGSSEPDWGQNDDVPVLPDHDEPTTSGGDGTGDWNDDSSSDGAGSTDNNDWNSSDMPSDGSTTTDGDDWGSTNSSSDDDAANNDWSSDTPSSDDSSTSDDWSQSEIQDSDDDIAGNSSDESNDNGTDEDDISIEIDVTINGEEAEDSDDDDDKNNSGEVLGKNNKKAPKLDLAPISDDAFLESLTKEIQTQILTDHQASLDVEEIIDPSIAFTNELTNPTLTKFATMALNKVELGEEVLYNKTKYYIVGAEKQGEQIILQLASHDSEKIIKVPGKEVSELH